MWAFFIVSQVAFIAEMIIDRIQSKAEKAGNMEKSDRLNPYYDEALNVSVVALMSGHWFFAIKYAELVLKLPLLVWPETIRDMQAKLKNISCIIWILNGLFATSIFLYVLLFQLYIYDVGNFELAWVYHMADLAALMPTVLLLVTVIKVRCMVNRMRNKAIFQKEKLILVHTILFSLYFLLYVTNRFAT